MNTTTTETKPTVAETTFNQINALDFWARARWGVKKAINDGITLRLQCARGRRILVTLDEGSDTYTITMGYVTKDFRFVELGQEGETYAEDLVKTIDRMIAFVFKG